MAHDVVMPQMGESIAEGTVSKWLKKVGDRVERDEPLLEISTDKVDAEIPSPAAGTLTEILANEGDTVAVNSVIGRIAAEGEEAAPAPQAPPPAERTEGQSEGQQASAPAPAPEPAPAPAPAAAPAPQPAPAPAASGGAAHDVVMPQMGESIAEGTVSKWLKQVGDKVDRDEPLLEISTDKVDAEIPSPAAGILLEIVAQEGATVPVNAVVARIGTEGQGQAQPAPQPAAAAPAPAPESPRPAEREEAQEDEQNVTSLDERRRTRSSPLVRKIAAENNVDIRQVTGTGVSGRVTKNDILDYIQNPKPAAAAPKPAAAPAPAPQSRPTPAPAPAPAPRTPGQTSTVEPLSVMRKKIAHHMVQSKQTSAHVHTVFEIDFTNVDKLRRKHKDAYAERGVKLTFMPFIVQAIIAGLREFPVLNASMSETSVTYHHEHNIGIAVALEWGLIVPVLKRADEMNILGLSRAINDLGDRARTKKLTPDDVQGGTFTITNPGIFGGLFGLPIINQPQVAILGVGGIKKRPVVMETKEGDFIAIRSMCYFSLGFDHRLIDGAVADQFMARVKQILEAGQFTM
ncbi:MAG TPA: 2-oxoglutarate dehydrogenase, E2 component, dihydrolipoamide succinyltransferase [Thermoanaerobaculia bacterium]|nr:2-oxoglutarate dehydrogenase, E2 component, dihydrolipoamide succinyltransferase [Thermoanaerobaculia bacterium]